MRSGTVAGLVLAGLLLPAVPAGAQASPEFELGVNASVSRLSSDFGSFTVVQVPGGGSFLAPLSTVYATFFMSGDFVLEPQGSRHVRLWLAAHHG